MEENRPGDELYTYRPVEIVGKGSAYLRLSDLEEV